MNVRVTIEAFRKALRAAGKPAYHDEMTPEPVRNLAHTYEKEWSGIVAELKEIDKADAEADFVRDGILT